MKRLLTPLVAISAIIAIGAGTWIATIATPSAISIPQDDTSTAKESTRDLVRYLVAASTSDFTPPVGPSIGTEVPPWGKRRLMTATSVDGITFTPTGKILTDRANVPDLVTDPDGTLRLYYIGQGIVEGQSETTAMALSRDHGATWEFHLLSFSDLKDPNHLPSDPDVVLLADGTYRMFYTTSVSAGNIGIAYADSTDGISFTYKDIALSAESSVVDSTTFFADGEWHMLVLPETGGGQLHATSADGMNFSLTNTTRIPLQDPSYILSNPLPDTETSHIIGFSLPRNNLRRFAREQDGSWTMEGVVLAGNSNSLLDATYIQDLSVAKQEDGTYLMVYVAGTK